MRHCCKFGITNSDLLFHPPHYIHMYYIGHWSVGGVCMNIIQNVDVACFRGEPRDSSWNTGSRPLPSFPKKRGPCGPLNDVETRRVPMVKGTLFISLDLIGPILKVCWKVAPAFLVTCLLLRISSDGAIQYSITANTWVSLCACHTGWSWTDLASLSILSLIILWTDLAFLSQYSLTFNYWTCRAGGRYIQYLLKKVGIGSILHLPCDLFCLPSKFDICSTLYLYILYHPCHVAICIHLQCHKPPQYTPKLASMMIIKRWCSSRHPRCNCWHSLRLCWQWGGDGRICDGPCLSHAHNGRRRINFCHCNM